MDPTVAMGRCLKHNAHNGQLYRDFSPPQKAKSPEDSKGLNEACCLDKMTLGDEGVSAIKRGNKISEIHEPMNLRYKAKVIGMFTVIKLVYLKLEFNKSIVISTKVSDVLYFAR